MLQVIFYGVLLQMHVGTRPDDIAKSLRTAFLSSLEAIKQAHRSGTQTDIRHSSVEA